MENEGVPSKALREISILQELSHTNIVTLQRDICKDYKLYLLFKLLKMDFNQYIESLDRNDFMLENLIKSYMY
jgi:hypothetical protein